jgi:hypothetical protein
MGVNNKWIVATNKGDVKIEAADQGEARRKAQDKGHVVLSVRLDTEFDQPED